MIQSVIYGVIGAAFCLGGVWLSSVAFSPSSSSEPQVQKPAYDVRKASSLNVPFLRGGQVLGYIVIQLSYAVDRGVKDVDHVAVETLLHDEAFRTLYGDQRIDPRSLEKYDLNSLIKQLLARVRSRIGSEAIQDILVSEFSFIPASSNR